MRRFYADTLPELGWHPRSELVYERDNERLEIGLSTRGGALVVRFDIAPRRRP